MPPLPEGHHDDDSSSDDSSFSIHDFMLPESSPMPAATPQNVILNLDLLQDALIHDSVGPIDADNDEDQPPIPLTNTTVYVDTATDSDYLNDLSVPRVTEVEFWDDFFTLDDLS